MSRISFLGAGYCHCIRHELPITHIRSSSLSNTVLWISVENLFEW
jgi:hypothetical protein